MASCVFVARAADCDAGAAHILFVPGNHEFHGSDIEEARRLLARDCADCGVTLLDTEAVTIGHVRFIGATLWTDFRLYSRSGRPGSGTGGVRDWLTRSGEHGQRFVDLALDLRFPAPAARQPVAAGRHGVQQAAEALEAGAVHGLARADASFRVRLEESGCGCGCLHGVAPFQGRLQAISALFQWPGLRPNYRLSKQSDCYCNRHVIGSAS